MNIYNELCWLKVVQFWVKKKKKINNKLIHFGCDQTLFVPFLSANDLVFAINI